MLLFDLNNEEEKKKEYEKLIKDIEIYNHHYYNLDESLITDREYDALLKKIELLEKEFPELKLKNSPTEIIGGKSSDKFKKVKHKKAMLSLANTYSMDDLKAFDQRVKKEVGNNVEYVLELKLDGLSISLIYEKGKLIQAVTRGDGSVGEDVTENVIQISTIPKILKDEIDLEVRGEIVLPLKEFERINREREENGETIFANPRNVAAGTIRQLDYSIVKDRNLDCYLYYLVDSEKYGLNTQLESIEYIQKLGFKTTGIFTKCSKIEDLEKEIEYWDNNRKKLEYETDGLVIKVNEYYLHNLLGYTAKSPRWAMAYKFKAEQKETKMLDISFQVGRTGVITPVAELEPVHISGSVVRRASLHNIDEIKRLGLKIGDIVIVEKAAEIIPQVVKVLLEKRSGNEKEIEIIDKCPSCNNTIFKEEGQVALKCKNPNCVEKLKRKIEYFVSRDALNIQGFGNKLVDKFVDLGYIRSIIDIFKLKNHKEELINLDKMGTKSIEKLLDNIDKAKDIGFEKLFYSLGIEYVGKTTSKLVVSHFGSIENIINASLEELVLIEGIGEKVSLSIYNYFKDNENISLINEIKNIGFDLSFEKEQILNNNFITNKKFLATGKFVNYSREEIKKVIEKNGGIYLSSVNKNLDYLIIGEKAGSKLEKAEKLGVRIITEEEFLKLSKLKGE
ncbi:NAD-dependent DNA ligase LigA [Streptobacillus moniliformis]|uniref:DNA ligase n=1 Tax=Streptobacillus moniliformis (strain ATCC 14647 / DSM 12112 / NCTC 10651 / 9901) TaxID=519441 RepID=D1AYN7_STRM9|nr:NAD-dependent DNA ligase LigA [Streptobacillus moniliformis]ACZ01413.1 DNA ligase, NAD-dependent [Streptobacillus moniliformis DSM 12112]AVL43575.1 NAD-dependent DNA ligase LigA [Streptobacillus moniliformis]SQA13427.1 DNA ligase [Streptobacillus moniliformis]